MVTPREHLLIMGIRNFPYDILDPSRSDHLSLGTLRSLAGNGMHAAAIGSVLVFTLGAYEWV